MTQRASRRPGYDPAAYGDRHAHVYDRIYGARSAPGAAVDALAAAGRDGGVLELGAGTGRLAIPLAARGIQVDGIEASPAMAAELRSRPGGDAVGIVIADMAGFDLPYRHYGAAVCAVSTLFMLPHPAQQSCIQAAARHLRPGGTLFIETFRLDPRRFDAHGHRTEQRHAETGTHTVRSRHDPAAQALHITHILGGGDGASRAYDVTLWYTSLAQLDAMARAAGLERHACWHDWTGTPLRPGTTDPVSLYRRPCPGQDARELSARPPGTGP
ncbi:MAG: class I SAM-dependent methyltransferase [Streptosporangiaceae bacterium]